MAFNVQSAGLLTTGTTGPDYFIVRSAAVQAAILKVLWQYTIMARGRTICNRCSHRSSRWRSTIRLSGGDYSATAFLAGAGADTITVYNHQLQTRLLMPVLVVTALSCPAPSSILVLGGGVDIAHRFWIINPKNLHWWRRWQ